VDSDLEWLAVLGVLNAIIALYYYLVVIKTMFFDPSPDEDVPVPMSTNYVWALGGSALGVILVGTVLAQTIINWASDAGLSLLANIPPL
jgi:NADH-quinone oxidoreductase subunit N